MTIYAIGDIQGCYDPLMQLLEKVDFNDRSDTLWLVGDLVNRGPKSLEVLRFLKNLPRPPVITLGNHDLHLLGRMYVKKGWKASDDTLELILKAPDAEELGYWLRHQKIMHYDAAENAVMSHAGIAPCWDLETAVDCAHDLEAVLRGDNFVDFLKQMYGNKPDIWDPALRGVDRLRVITNYFTRMRFCDARGALVLDCNTGITDEPPGCYPWFSVPSRKTISADILFGHWAALEGHCPVPGIYALDTGSLWGGCLTALRLSDRKRFSV